MSKIQSAEVIIIGGGLAGLSAAIYLGRAKRDTLVIDSGRSMARWEPDVENYLGFPSGISGDDLLARARRQARTYQARFVNDEIVRSTKRPDGGFRLRGRKREYECRRLLLATGIFHIPPDLPHVKPCLGHSMFFCKDCDGYRVQGKDIAIYGWSNETADYALSMLLYSPCVAVVTDGRPPRWDGAREQWLREYKIPVYLKPILDVRRKGSRLVALDFKDKTSLMVDSLFTTRGDIYYNQLAKDLGAEINSDGEIVIQLDMRTSVEGLYAAGCVTPANCQMIIAAGQGATAAQAINRNLFEESLATHSLRRFRKHQLRRAKTRPRIVVGARRK